MPVLITSNMIQSLTVAGHVYVPSKSDDTFSEYEILEEHIVAFNNVLLHTVPDFKLKAEPLCPQ